MNAQFILTLLAVPLFTFAGIWVNNYFQRKNNKDQLSVNAKHNDKIASLEERKVGVQEYEAAAKAGRETIDQLYKLISFHKEEAQLVGERADAAIARLEELNRELQEHLARQQHLEQRVAELEREVADLKQQLRDKGIEVE